MALKGTIEHNVNWRKLGVEELMNRYGMEKARAEIVWERGYRKALYHARKRGVGSDFNISREVYASAFYRGEQLFDIRIDEFSPKVRIDKSYENVTDLEAEFTDRRFRNMANTYKKVNDYLNDYRSGKITYEQFRRKVQHFKTHDKEYLSRGAYK